MSSIASRRTFGARIDGGCGGCGQPIHVGDDVFFVGNNELPIGSDCCGDRPDEELVAPGRREDYDLPGGLALDEEDPARVIAQTLPRGKTARDACGTCWQIPANNGSCGCDY